MLLGILTSDMPFAEKLLYALIVLVAVLTAMTIHEFAHGFTAYKLGDNTARFDGRLSLNPLDHLDPFGFLMLALFGFGWAKPVPVMTRNFKKPKRDFALTSLAGPLSNFVLAFLTSFLTVLFGFLSFGGSPAMAALYSVFYYMTLFNIGLGLFNLIPLPPLDGSNVLMCILPNHLAAQYSKIRYYTRYIFLGIILLSYLNLPIDVFAPLGILRDWIYGGFYNIAFRVISPFFGI